MKKAAILLVIATVLLIAMVPWIYDNRDNSIWKEQTSDTEILVGSARRLLLQQNKEMMMKSVQEEEDQRVLKLKSLFTQTKHVCLNGKDPKKLNYEQIVNEFINGPCSPVILVPGLAGTSLEIQVDCEKLQAESPEIFESCGWQTCNPWYIWYSRPDSEYRLWISTTTSTVGVIQTSPKDHCFGNLMELKYDHTTQKHIKTPGLEVTYYGNTESTKKYNECGLGAVKDMTDDYLIKYMMCDYKGFLNIGELLQNMGYISGLTFQAIPYDYRKGIQQSEVTQLVKQTIQNLNQISGKKAIILTHSLGSLHTLHMLGQMSQQEKQDSISVIMTMGAPYLGSSKAVRAHLGGDPSFLDTFLGLTVGINYFNQNKAINAASSQVDIYPKPTFYQYFKEPWMQEILKRIQEEKEFLEKKSSNITALSWFPNPSEICTNLTDFHSECLMNLQDLREHFISIENKEFTTQELQTIINNYTVNGSLISEFYQNYQSEALNTLKNPEVPFIVLYGGFSETEYQFQYSDSPLKEVTQNFDFYFPNKTKMAIGDQTVLTSSALTPAIKWIYEHQNNQSTNPIKVIQYCSNYKGSLQQQLFDTVDHLGQKTFTKSGYQGLECECLGKGQAISNCKHSCMINDKFIVELTSQLVQNQQKSNILKTSYSQKELEQFVKECQNLKVQ